MIYPSDDVALLQRRAALGDERAYADLMRLSQDATYRLIVRYVFDRSEAYDLLQESYAAGWLAIRRYDPTRPFGPWLKRIALNKCRDWGRRRLVRQAVNGVLGLETPEAHLAADPALGAESQLIERESSDRLAREIARLPAQLKEPLLLTAIEGLSQGEAAALLGISTKAVESRTYRARQRLLHRLGSSS